MGRLRHTLSRLSPRKYAIRLLSLPYHIGNGVFGGLVPLIGVYVCESTHNITPDSTTPMIVASITFVVGSLFLKETHGHKDLGRSERPKIAATRIEKNCGTFCLTLSSTICDRGQTPCANSSSCFVCFFVILRLSKRKTHRETKRPLTGAWFVSSDFHHRRLYFKLELTQQDASSPQFRWRQIGRDRCGEYVHSCQR